ncbi:hypothetical protein LGM89_06495 [Burkholderia sp. AU31624]|uniref:hypothetical protein n=1 Tax=Burkholderia sp. AU31624 TaxID=2879629 RepID=UPI001CF3B96D|nr:hypothetical protein [Burkholderia sp. AU31624]MCA8252903.1 hypothetical protein [Burkholderia sp. AU31624]
MNAARARTFAALPDVLKCHQRSMPIAAHAGVAAARVCPRDAARDAARTTHGRGRLAAPNLCNWSQS